eukprot:EG_transcript_47790
MSSYTGAALAPKSERLRLAFEEKQKDHQKCIEEAKGKGLKKDELIDACAWTHRKTILKGLGLGSLALSWDWEIDPMRNVPKKLCIPTPKPDVQDSPNWL